MKYDNIIVPTSFEYDFAVCETNNRAGNVGNHDAGPAVVRRNNIIV